MKQVIQSYKTGEIKLLEVPVPLCKSGGVLVHNVCSIVSAGTEKLMIDMAKRSLVGKAVARPDLARLAYQNAKRDGVVTTLREAMNRLDEPTPLGYSSAGIVIEVGSGAEEFKVGDRVACAGSGFANHAEFVFVPKNLCIRIPKRRSSVTGYTLQADKKGYCATNNEPGDDFISFEEAAFAMLGAIALHGVRLAKVTFGETVAVIGLGLLGLLTVQILAACGCTVIGIDIDRRKGELATELGCDEALMPSAHNQIRDVDAVVITAAAKDNKPLLLAEKICRKKARIVLVGMADIRLIRQTLWEKEISFIVSKAAGPGSIEEAYERKGYDYPLEYVRWTEKRNMEYFLKLVAEGKVRIDKLITHRITLGDALKAYEMILSDREPYIGVVLEYPVATSGSTLTMAKRVEIKETDGEPPITGSRCSIGLIGGGNFAKNILLPNLRKIRQVNLLGAATTTGATSQHIANKFGFRYCASDYREILRDRSIGSVIITTRHNLHAKMVMESLRAGKNVFVEKPLCINQEQLNQILETYSDIRNSKSPISLLMVGLNRRFAPLMQEVKKVFLGRNTPLVMNYRVNAGYIPEDHWTQDPEIGGGRIIGEVCHFIDLFQFLTDSTPKVVFAQSISGNLGKYLATDNLCLVINFEDGSIGNILYTTKGTRAFSREKLEIFGEDSVAVVEDFRKTLLVRDGKTKKVKRWNQDLGYLNELRHFLGKEKSGGDIGKLFTSSVYTTVATFKALESLQEGVPINIDIILFEESR